MVDKESRYLFVVAADILLYSLSSQCSFPCLSVINNKAFLSPLRAHVSLPSEKSLKFEDREQNILQDGTMLIKHVHFPYATLFMN